jgi:hypothetical protein
MGTVPRVVASLQPWAEVSQRLRRMIDFRIRVDAIIHLAISEDLAFHQ